MLSGSSTRFEPPSCLPIYPLFLIKMCRAYSVTRAALLVYEVFGIYINPTRHFVVMLPILVWDFEV